MICLENSFNVPLLDADLFLTMQYGRNGKGCSILPKNLKMHLIFLEFSVTHPIPADGDLRLNLNKLTEQDWDLPDFICDCIEGDIKGSLETLEWHMGFLNHVFCRKNVTACNQ